MTNPDPKFSVDQIEHIRHLMLNQFPKSYQECCVFRHFEKEVKKSLRKLMEEAKKEENGN